MKLPKWDILKANFPAKPAGEVFQAIGGKVLYNYQIGVFSNACSSRISAALNASGKEYEIPFFKEEWPKGKVQAQVSSGADGKWYIFRVKMLVKHLTTRYGKPEEYLPEEHLQKIAGRKGIIVFEVKGWADATGHADLWDGTACLWHGYDEVANKVLFWEAEADKAEQTQTAAQAAVPQGSAQ
ncbi:type VI secretion system amidase effector protein Tae4 [Candidatus Electronema sp. JM]|uniref:type VI secretion system amidase effector protein Tae4 n=1 Tax=Candidatus Electronema sp. JM TaxID=3401571 RepID=UPI003AA7D996